MGHAMPSFAGIKDGSTGARRLRGFAVRNMNPAAAFWHVRNWRRATMVDHKTVRKIALTLPEVTDNSESGLLRLSVGGRGFAWTYFERIAPKRPRVARPDVLAVRCAVDHKEMLIEAEPAIFFDDDHYRGYPAVLVRLEAIDRRHLAVLLDTAWRSRAPKRLLKSHQLD